MDRDLFPLLEAIRGEGKLTAAAAQVGIPYRQAWQRIQTWEEELGAPLVQKERGRGTRLTSLGERLVDLQIRVNALLEPHLQRASSEIGQELQALLLGGKASLSMVASHDLALNKLIDYLHTRSGTTLEVRFAGSLQSLMSLARGDCELGGIHLPEGPLGAPIGEIYRPWLDSRSQRLIHFVMRSQGLIVPPGNPLGLQDVVDIAGKGARFVNRQPGSGTRLALDQMLERVGLDSEQITGYHAEEYTHLAVAAAVAGGMADVGLGEEAAARMLELDFVPLYREVYYLVVGARALDQQRFSELLSVLRGDDFQDLLHPLSGYDGAGAGEILSPDVLFAKEGV
ncbi:substrate-binding domain-containing protein [Thiohalorhabdus sp. Cl-TMA]|uniref:Substrate-binding domain-containing protein n=1 Tax=Thiohalorhabdus methylotrophus TaxID=3242694 RepID=A0ABV4TVA7_9GAMM